MDMYISIHTCINIYTYTSTHIHTHTQKKNLCSFVGYHLETSVIQQFGPRSKWILFLIIHGILIVIIYIQPREEGRQDTGFPKPCLDLHAVICSQSVGKVQGRLLLGFPGLGSWAQSSLYNSFLTKICCTGLMDSWLVCQGYWFHSHVHLRYFRHVTIP